VRDTLDLIKSTALGQSKCNACFQALRNGWWIFASGGRSFDDVFNDRDIWISYHWDKSTGFDGLTSMKKEKEITISQSAFDRGLRAVAATIVHELAHVNSAPAAPSTAAESTLQNCGFSDQFNPNAIGVNVHASPSRGLYRPSAGSRA
jgi:hypothetical protein